MSQTGVLKCVSKGITNTEEIAKTLDLSQPTIIKSIHKLVEKELLRRDYVIKKNKFSYVLTESGRDYLLMISKYG